MENGNNIKPIILNKPNPDDVKIAQGIKNINSDILQGSFIKLIIGKPGCGKSHLIREFILNKDLYYKKFALILFVTPSRFEDKDLQLDEYNHRNFVDPPWLHQTLRDFKEFCEEQDPEHGEKNILIIFDDVIAELRKLEKDPSLMSLFYNRRHILGSKFLISHLVTTQKYTMCPPKLRSALTAVIAFPMMAMDWRKLEEECIYDSFDRKWTSRFLKDCKEQKFSFIYIRLDNSKIFYKFEKCLNI